MLYSKLIVCPQCGNERAVESGKQTDDPDGFLPYSPSVPQIGVPRFRECDQCGWVRDLEQELQKLLQAKEEETKAMDPVDAFCAMLKAEVQWIKENA
jgi:hypothetical protein